MGPWHKPTDLTPGSLGHLGDSTGTTVRGRPKLEKEARTHWGSSLGSGYLVGCFSLAQGTGRDLGMFKEHTRSSEAGPRALRQERCPRGRALGGLVSILRRNTAAGGRGALPISGEIFGFRLG